MFAAIFRISSGRDSGTRLTHATESFSVLHLAQRVEDGRRGAVIGHVQIADRRAVLVLGNIEDMLFLHRTVVDDLLFLVRQVFEGNIRANAHLPADVCHQRPHQGVPRRDRTLVDGLAFIRNERRPVNRSNHSRAAAAFARSGGVEGKILRDQVAVHCRHVDAGLHIVTIGTAVAGKAGEHQPQAVQQLRPRSKGGADAGNGGSLMQGKGGGNVQHLVHIGASCLSHAPPCVGGQRFKISARALGI